MSASVLSPTSVELLAADARHVWHPYGGFPASTESLPVASAEGVRLRLADGRELIDGMSSWWAAIHGYRHPHLDAAAHRQVDTMSHVMFGGLTHAPAVELATRLARLAPGGLSKVFLADSGSVSVEVAAKMAIQYQRSRGRPGRTRLATWRGGYHGDTLAPMSVCDPDGGMHSMWGGVVREQVFAPAPPAGHDTTYVAELERTIRDRADELAAIIVEPVVQGAGGMRFHHPDYLRDLRRLADEADILLIFDEIATAFGRTGELFAADHAGVAPDICCVGKALTGGYLTLAATLTTDHVAETISNGEAGGLAHGPTFMGNPLACAVANASLDLVESGAWREQVPRIEARLRRGLAPARDLPGVVDVRVLGAIGLIHMAQPVDMVATTRAITDRGVWLRPFGDLIYTMPPYICSNEEVDAICGAALAGAVAGAAAGAVAGARAPVRPPPRTGPAPVAESHPSPALDWLDAAAADRGARHLHRVLRPREPDDAVLDLASNDYLGLSRHPEVVEGAISATRRWGSGATGSRLVTGTTTDHEALERELADFTGAPTALVFSSGYTANLGAVVALSGRGSLIVSDGGSHASLVDACRLSRARVVVVDRGDIAAVERALAGRTEERALVVTDSVYSADGDLAPLADLHEACERHAAVLLVDEAHGLGVRGAGGRGLVNELGLTQHENVVVTATLSKALGAQGGVVLTSERVREHLIDTARTFVFDTGLAPAAVGAARAALAVLRREPERARRVLEVAEHLAAVTGADRPSSAVVSVILGDPARAVSVAGRCRELGVRVGCFRPPSVPEGTARLRLTARADLSSGELATASDVLVLALAEQTVDA